MDLEQALARLRTTGGDAHALTLTALDILLEQHGSALRTALEAAAIPHWFDARILAQLLQVTLDDATALIGNLVKLSVVERFDMHCAWNVHEATRLALRRHLAADDPAGFRVLSYRASRAFRGLAAALRVETLYHRLIAMPKLGARQLRRISKAWACAGSDEALQALGFALEELLRTEQLQPPARARALLSFSRIRRGRLNPLKHQALVVKAMSLFRRQNDRLGEAEAHGELGHVLRESGDLVGALDEYRTSAKLINIMGNKSSSQADWQAVLAEAHDLTGIVQQAMNDPAEALLEYQAARAIKARLARRDADALVWRRALGASHQCIGSVLLEQGDLVAARQEYEAYRSLMQRGAEREPGEIVWQRGLSTAHSCIGAVLRQQGELEQAVRAYLASQAILLDLTDRQPSRSDWRRDLAIVHYSLGAVSKERGDLRQALDECRAAQRVLSELRLQGLGGLECRRDLAIVHYLLGTILDECNEPIAACDEYGASKAILLEMKELDVESTEWRPSVLLWSRGFHSEPPDEDDDLDGILGDLDANISSAVQPPAESGDRVDPEQDTD